MEGRAGLHNPPDVAEQRNVVYVFKNVLTKNVVKCFTWKRKRHLFKVVYDVNAGKC